MLLFAGVSHSRGIARTTTAFFLGEVDDELERDRREVLFFGFLTRADGGISPYTPWL